MWDEDLPKPKGPLASLTTEDLSPMGVEALKERIDMLQTEIKRTEQALKDRDTSRSAAEAVFGS